MTSTLCVPDRVVTTTLCPSLLPFRYSLSTPVYVRNERDSRMISVTKAGTYSDLVVASLLRESARGYH